MPKLRRIAAFIAVVTIVPGLLFARSSPWPMFRHDEKHTGRTIYTGPADSILQWNYQTNDGVASSPAIGADGTIYVGSGWNYAGGTDFGLYALRPDGRLKWRFVATEGIFSSPAIGPDGVIYFGSLDGAVYAVEDLITRGRLKWRTDLGGYFILSSPTLGANGNLYIGFPGYRFHVLNSSTGEKLWNFPVGWCIISSAALGDDGTIYIGCKDHHLYAFRDDIQDTAWAFPTGTFYDGHLVDASPAIGADGTIYVGSDQFGAANQTPVPVDTSFWAINPDGSRKWAFFVGNGVESSPAIASDGTIYFGSYDSCLYAIADSGTYGALKWKFRTNGAVDGSPTVDDEGTIYFGSRDSTIHALNPDGTVRWTFRTGGGIESSPTIDNDGHLLIGSFDGKIYCLGTGAPDMAVTAVHLPDTLKAGYTYNPEAGLRNLRNRLQSLSLSCIVVSGDSTVYADTLAVADFPADTTAAVAFAPWMVGPDAAVTYTVTVGIILPEDDHPYNNAGYAQATSVAAVFVCGDANSDDQINVGDAVFVINYVFKGGSVPQPLSAGDANCDGTINVGDAVSVINYIFKGGNAPCCP